MKRQRFRHTGGIPAGTTFDNVPLQQVLDDILYPYTKPTISLAADPNGGVREKGTSLSPINLTATIGKKSSNITAVDFYKGSENIGSIEAPKAAGGTESHSYAGPITADCQISAKVTDEKGGIGEQGPQGIQGPQGPKGEKGDTGETVRVGTEYESATPVKLFFKKIV